MPIPQRQKVLNEERTPEWKINNVKYYYERCRPINSHFDALFRAANGEMDITEYNYFTNPFGQAIANRPELQSYPAKMRNVPIIPEIFNKLIGEMRDRPLVKYVSVTNSDMMNKKRAEEVMFFHKQLQQVYINELNALGIETGKDSAPVEPLDQVMKQFSNNWSDSRAITGQEVLNYVCDNLDIPEMFIDGFKYWVITGCVYTIKDVVNEDLIVEFPNPQYVGFIKDDNVKFIEDGEAACVTRRFTRASFMDRYSEMILNSDDYEAIVDYLDSPNRTTSDRAFVVDSTNLTNQYGLSESYKYTRDGNFTWLGDTCEVAYVNWKSEELVKVVAFMNELGEVTTEEMPDDYVVNKELGEELVEEYWRTTTWEGYCVDNNKFYFGIRKVPIQRNMINRKSKCKLLINGRVKTIGNRKQMSIIELLMPFQHLYNIIHYKLMNVLAKNKDKMLVMPIGLMPKMKGWDMYTSMYHMDATGIMWVDESNPQAQIALNSVKAVDMSLGSIIADTLQLLAAIKAQAAEIIGMTPQRKGAMGNRDGASVTQMAQIQSYQISEDLFAEYEKFQECELNGILDLSRYAYINGKKASYITSEGRLAQLNLEAGLGDFLNAELGVRVKSSSREKVKMEKLENMAETLASQKANPSTLATILQTDNFNELVDRLADIEAKERAYADQQAQAQREHEQLIADKQAQVAKDKLELEYYKIDANNDTKKEQELIKADVAMMGMDLDKNGIADSIQITQQALARDKQFFDQSVAQNKHLAELDKLSHTKKMDQAKLKLEEQKVKQGEKKLETEKYKVDTQLKIARENKNKHDV